VLESLRAPYYDAVLVIHRKDVRVIFKEEEDSIVTNLFLQTGKSLLFVLRGRKIFFCILVLAHEEKLSLLAAATVELEPVLGYFARVASLTTSNVVNLGTKLSKAL
jgi:hypothetical protein